MAKQESLLTEKDIALINKRRNINILIMMGSAVIVILLCYLMYASSNDITIMYVGLGVAVFFGLVSLIFVNKAKGDLATGTKYIIKGKVIKKEAVGGRGREFFVFIDDEKINITSKQYDQIIINDDIEVHYTLKSKSSLFMRNFTAR